MFEAYQVGVTLKLHNLISPQLALLSKEFEKLDLLTVNLNKSLSKIAVDSSAFRSLTTATNATNRALERASISAERLQGHLSAVHRLGSMPSPMLPAPGRPGGGGGGSRFGGRHSGFHGGNVHMGPSGIGIGSIGVAAGDAFVPLAVTAGLLYAGKSLFESAKALDTEKQRFKMFGLSDAQNNEAFKFAAGMHIYGSTQTENLRNFREAQGVFREAGLPGSEALAGAKLAAPILSKLNALDSALDDESKAKSATSNLAMLRFVESAGGLKSQDEFKRLANIGYKLKVGSGDTVNWLQLQQFEKRALSAGINLSEEGLARIEPSISTLGGSSVGTALRTSFGRLQGIIKGLPVPVIDELLKSGVWDKSKVELNSKGGIRKFLDDDGPLAAGSSKLLSENPELFYEQIIRPIYAKMHLDAAGILRQNALLFGGTGGGLANEWEKSLQKIGEAVTAYKKTLGIDAATAKLPDSLTGQEKEFEAAWTDFKTQFGTTVLPFFSGILKGGASIFRGINDGKPAATVSAFADLNKYAGNAIGKAVSDWFGEGPTRVALDKPGNNGSPFVITPAPVMLDGQKVGSVLFDVGGKSANAPQTGITLFDHSRGLIPAGGLGF